MLKIISLITVAVVLSAMGATLSYLLLENRNISNDIAQAYSSSDKDLHDEGLSILAKTNNKWVVNYIGINRLKLSNALSDIGIRNEHKDIFEKALVLMGEEAEEKSIVILNTIPQNSLYYQKAQTNIQKSAKSLLEKELSTETNRGLLLEEELRIAEHKISVEKSAKEQEAIGRKHAEESAEYQRLQKEEQSSARVAAETEAEGQRLAKEEQAAARRKAEQDTERERLAKEEQAAARLKAEQRAERERLAKEEQAAEAEMQRQKAKQEEKNKILILARTRPTIQAIVTGELKFYIAPVPYYAAPGVSNAVNEIAKAFTNIQLHGAIVRQVHNANSADLHISWIRDYGSDTLGEAIYQSVIKVGLGTQNCHGDWSPFTPSTVKKVLWHELGHSMGYVHSNDLDNVMYPYTDTRFTVDHEFSELIPSGYYFTVPFCDSGTYWYSVKSDNSYVGFDVFVLPPGMDPLLISRGEGQVYSGCGKDNVISISRECTVAKGAVVYMYNKSDVVITLSGEIIDQDSGKWPDMEWDANGYQYDDLTLESYWKLFH
jgi:hypothetical protein